MHILLKLIVLSAFEGQTATSSMGHFRGHDVGRALGRSCVIQALHCQQLKPVHSALRCCGSIIDEKLYISSYTNHNFLPVPVQCEVCDITNNTLDMHCSLCIFTDCLQASRTWYLLPSLCPLTLQPAPSQNFHRTVFWPQRTEICCVCTLPDCAMLCALPDCTMLHFEQLM